MSQMAAWIKAQGALLELGETETPAPGPGEILVKVRAIGFNPLESKMQRHQTVLIPYPNILGLSFAGYVESLGPDVTEFAVGDKLGVSRPLDKVGDPKYGAFQQFAIASAKTASKLESETPLHEAAATMINLESVVCALSTHLGLDRAIIVGDPIPTGKKILIYGGSSSTGGLAVYYALAGGYEVVTTSSPRNRDLVASYGPVTVIDHSQSPQQIVQELQNHGPYFKILDTIGLPSVTDILSTYLSSVGGGSYNTFAPLLGTEHPIPDNVQRHFATYRWLWSDLSTRGIMEWFYNDLVPKGLASGKIVPTQPHFIQGGLEQAQDALDMMDRGEVSGFKLILDPWYRKK